MKNILINKNIILDKKVYICIVITFLLGIILMITNKTSDSGIPAVTIPVNDTVKGYETDINIESSEYKLINILKKVEGVGEVDIIINYISTVQKVPLVEASSQDKGKIVNKTDGGKTEPYIITEKNPEIEGVVVVAEGGDDIIISNILKNTVSSYLGVPIHKINILKMK